MATIVVGVDGSSGAHAALRYAAREAKDKHATLRVVSAWTFPTMAYAGGIAPPIDPTVFEERAADVAQEATASAAEEIKEVPIEMVVQEGQPADVLVEAARDADLLVVGSRGLGGFKELLLGSVSHQCAQHAHCPILIVPESATRN